MAMPGVGWGRVGMLMMGPSPKHLEMKSRDARLLMKADNQPRHTHGMNGLQDHAVRDSGIHQGGNGHITGYARGWSKVQMRPLESGTVVVSSGSILAISWVGRKESIRNATVAVSGGSMLGCSIVHGASRLGVAEIA